MLELTNAEKEAIRRGFAACGLGAGALRKSSAAQ
jgi:hypothetical protein